MKRIIGIFTVVLLMLIAALPVYASGAIETSDKQ